jgi:hypothetical protein
MGFGLVVVVVATVVGGLESVVVVGTGGTDVVLSLEMTGGVGV